MTLRVRNATGRDDPEAALSIVTDARRRLRATNVTGGLAEHVAAAMARLELLLGERTRAEALARAVTGERGLLLRIHLALADGDGTRAIELATGRRWSNLGNELDALLARSAAESDRAAHAHVQEAVDLAAEEIFVRPFLEAAPSVQELALHVADRASSPDVRELAIAMRAGTAHLGAPALLEALSRREMDVLRHLRRPLTYQEIGRELFVSSNTVRTHVRGIYRKLGVTSRAEALARARSLRLL